MMLIYFLNGLAFWGLGLAAYLQAGRDVSHPLRKQMPWLAAFGFVAGINGWVEMFLTTDSSLEIFAVLKIVRMILQPTTGLLLLIFGWRILARIIPLPAWVIYIPGVLVVPVTFVIAYASTTFVTPSPIEIPIDIWSRYLLYLPGSIMAGIGFLRLWKEQKQVGNMDVSSLMLGAGIAFLFEAFVVGLVVPAAPYAPASYYNYNRVVTNAFVGENMDLLRPYGLSAWLDYTSVLEVTGLPIQFWRMISSFLVTLFVARGLNVFDATLQRQFQILQTERDHARETSFKAQLAARITAENWTNALVNISRRITELDDVDSILLYIVDISRRLLDSDFMGLALLSGEQSQLELKCFSDNTKTEVLKSSTPLKNPLVLHAINSDMSYRSVGNESSFAFTDACLFNDQSAQAIAVVVLKLDDLPIGALWVARFEHNLYSETDLIGLESLADQVEIAIKHGVMTSQLQTLSITEERARIAREMHDSLAQILGYLNLQIQALEVLNQQGNEQAIDKELQKMRAEVRTAHADVRENILSLRTTLSSEKGMIAAIEEYLGEFNYMTGIKVSFTNEIADDPLLSSIAEIQLVCIMQEALANVRKHAHSRHVLISISQIGEPDDQMIRMMIEDDGVGFITTDQKGHFGLATMKERAKSVNGDLIIHTTVGKGTQVICQLPCLRHVDLIRHNLEFHVS